MSVTQQAEAALNEILLKEHRLAMRRFESYAQFIEANAATKEARLELGLRYQRRRYAIGAKKRHRDIWAAVRAYEISHAGPKRSPGGKVSGTAGHAISVTGLSQ